MKKILILNYEYPPIGGGGATVTRLLIEEFLKQKKEVFLITSHFKGLPILEMSRNFIILRIPVLRHKKEKSNLLQMSLYILGAIFVLPFVRLFFNYDLAHAHFILPTGVVCLFSKLLFNRDFFITAHGGDIPSHQPQDTNFLFNFLKPVAKLIIKKSKKIICISPDLYQKAIGDFPISKRKFIIIENGISIKKENVKLKNENRFLFVGRLSNEKKVLEIVQQFAKLEEEKFIFDIIGNGNEMEKIKKYIKNKNLSKKVILHNWQNQKYIQNLLEKTDFFIMNSKVEGLSMAALEALNYGLPIISSDCTGMKKLVKNDYNGFIHHNFQELKENIFKAIHIDSKVYQILSLNALKSVQKFDIKLTAQKYLLLFKNKKNSKTIQRKENGDFNDYL